MVRRIARLVDSFWFRLIVMTVIVTAGVLVGVETYPGIVQEHGAFINTLDSAIGVFFIVEIALRVIAYGSRPWRFFTDWWNVFDFVIVAACVLPLQVEYFAVLRLVRVFRVLRLISVLPGLQVLVGALLKSVPSIGYISILLFLHFYIYACLGSFMFGAVDPLRFGSLDRSMLSLFQVVTLEGWVDIMETQRFVEEISSAGETLLLPSKHYWAAPVFFISFILLGTMIILNLFIGVILNGMAEIKEENDLREIVQKKRKANLTVGDEVHLILTEVEEIRGKLDQLRFRIHEDIREELRAAKAQRNGRGKAEASSETTEEKKRPPAES